MSIFSTTRLFFTTTLLWVLTCGSFAEAHDFSDWDAILKKYVAHTTIAGVRLNGVAYGKLKDDPQFKKLIVDLKNVSPESSKPHQLSFWINVYNILAVKVVADHYPLKSIKDVGSLLSPVWKHPVAVVAGRERTLHEIEHEILRPLAEPRVHMAIVCASVSCPDLRPEAYIPDRLDAQLDDQVKSFVENTGKGMKIDMQSQKVYISSVFKWFAEDFEAQGGVRRFIARYVSTADQKILNEGKLKISYLDYNWDLNGR